MKVEVSPNCLRAELWLTQEQGCERGLHLPTPEKPVKAPPKPSVPLDLPLSSEGGKEVFASGPSIPQPISQAPATPKPVVPIVVEEEDDHTIDVIPGTQCKRNGCRVEFVSKEENRVGDGEGTVCTYHPGAVRALLLFWRDKCSSLDSQYSMRVARYDLTTTSEGMLY